MRITRDKARCLVQVLEDAREDYQGREGNTSTLWERQRKGILDRLKDLPPPGGESSDPHPGETSLQG